MVPEPAPRLPRPGRLLRTVLMALAASGVVTAILSFLTACKHGGRY